MFVLLHVFEVYIIMTKSNIGDKMGPGPLGSKCKGYSAKEH